MSHSDKSSHPNDEYKSHIGPNTALNMQLESKRDMGPRRSRSLGAVGGHQWVTAGTGGSSRRSGKETVIILCQHQTDVRG